MSARAEAIRRWGVQTLVAEQYDVVLHRAGRYASRLRCTCPDEAHAAARKATLGRRRSIAVVVQWHVGVIATYSGNRSEVPQ